MKLFLTLLLGVCILSACNSKDTQFCNCMEVSNQFNKISNNILKTGSNPSLEKEFKSLKLKKSKTCKNYLEMGGKEMLEKKAACEN